MRRFANERWTAADIRNELYGLHNEVRMSLNEHLSAVMRGEWHGQHVEHECNRCKWEKAQLGTLGRVIRHFGGRIRR